MDDVPDKNDKSNPDKTINQTRLAKTKFNLNTSMTGQNTQCSVECGQCGREPSSPRLPLTPRHHHPEGWSTTSSTTPGTAGEEHHHPEGWSTTSATTPGEHHPAPWLENQPITVLCGNRPDPPARGLEREAQVLQTVRRSNKQLVATQLPTVFVTNHRSFFPKFHNFVEVMKTLELTLGLHSEIWEDKENKEHTSRIEEAYRFFLYLLFKVIPIQMRRSSRRFTLPG